VATPPAADHDPVQEEIGEAWAALGWTLAEGNRDRSAFTGDDYTGHLSALIDQMNAQEAS
jgi:acetyl esterase/lipase